MTDIQTVFGSYYLVKDWRTGKYLTRVPRKQSYSRDLRKAELFKTYEAARRECCPESDIVTTIEREFI